MLEWDQPDIIHRAAHWCRTKQTEGTGLGEGDTTGAKDITEEIENEDQLLGAQAKDQPQDQPQVLADSRSLPSNCVVDGSMFRAWPQHSLTSCVWGLPLLVIKSDLLASFQSQAEKSSRSYGGPICCTVNAGWQPHLPVKLLPTLFAMTQAMDRG